ncbi:MAG: hypothetical protein K8R35_06875 [Bacteroidales bacterium]|nr:hypothetical protein [Bacteroidales bacterium]
MRITIVILLFFLSATICGQDVKLSVYTQSSWPPGSFVPVTVEIRKDNLTGFARFFQDLPQGFDVESVETNGGDFYFDDNQVNIVWVNMDEKDSVRVRYLVRADESLSGSFRLGGRFDYIINGRERRSAEVNTILIKLDREAEVEDISVPERTGEPDTKIQAITETKTKTVSETKAETGKKSKIEFRVQISLASLRLSKDELESRIGCTLKHDIKILKVGNMYKYQSGSFGKYNKASEYLEELKADGVKDVFVVAFRGGEQISVNLARSLTE